MQRVKTKGQILIIPFPLKFNPFFRRLNANLIFVFKCRRINSQMQQHTPPIKGNTSLHIYRGKKLSCLKTPLFSSSNGISFDYIFFKF